MLKWSKPLLFLVCLLPLVWLIINADALGPDPGKELVLFAGLWTLRFLLLTLAITPLREWTGLSGLVRYRRMLGLYTWFYANLHFLAVFTYLIGWSGEIFIEEFSERPYMALGITAWLLLIPLGVTSNQRMIRLLGRKWKKLHQLVYLIAVLGCVHFLWLIRSDYGEAVTYSAVFALLLLARVKFIRQYIRAQSI